MTARSDLPALLQRYIDQVLPTAGLPPKQVVLRWDTDSFELDGRSAFGWSSMTVWLGVEEVQYRMESRVGKRITLRKDVDTYADGLETHTVKALLWTTQRRGPNPGPPVDYLSNLPFVPHALALNRHLRWQEIDGRRLMVTAAIHPDASAMTFEFGEDGKFLRCTYDESGGEARSWGDAAKDPFTLDYRLYEAMNGVLIPTEMIATPRPLGRRFSSRIGSVEHIEGHNG